MVPGRNNGGDSGNRLLISMIFKNPRSLFNSSTRNLHKLPNQEPSESNIKNPVCFDSANHHLFFDSSKFQISSFYDFK